MLIYDSLETFVRRQRHGTTPAEARRTEDKRGREMEKERERTMMARSPLAPVLRSMASAATACSASSLNDSSHLSIANSTLYCATCKAPRHQASSRRYTDPAWNCATLI